MTSLDILPKSMSNGSGSKDTDYESDEDDFDSRAPTLQSLQKFETESRGSLTVDKLPGTSLLRSMHTKDHTMLSNHGSVKSLESNQTYAFNNDKSEHDGVDEFAEDGSNRSLRSFGYPSPTFGSKGPKPSSSNDDSKDDSKDSSNTPAARVPAWKLRQQAKMEAAPPAKKIIDSVVKTTNPEVNVANGKTTRTSFTRPRGSPTRTVKKTNSSSEKQQTWFQKLRESPDEKEKRLKRQALIERQNSSQWGKDILEEDSTSGAYDEEEDEKTPVTTDDSNKTPKQKNSALLKKKEKKKEGEGDDDDEKENGGDDDDETYESDTVKKVKSLIEKSFGSALIAHTGKDKKTPKAPSASVFQKEEDKEGTDEEAAPPRPNRFAMMRSAAMTSVRNLQKGLTRGDDDENLNEELRERPKRSKTINEDDEDDEDDDEEEKGDEVGDIGNKRRSLWKNRGGAVFTSVRNAWGGSSRKMEDVDLDEDGDGLDSKTVHSEPDRLDHKSNDNEGNIFSHIAMFLKHTQAKFDPKIWEDPEIQATLANIEKLRIRMQENRNEYRNQTRRREKQIENSILQQKTFLARKLARQMYGYKKDPFHQCIKEVYQKEILIIVHEATSIHGDGPEKDALDDILDANIDSLYDFDIKEEPDDNKSNDGSIFSFGIKKRFPDDQSVDTLMSDSNFKPVNRESCVSLETRLLRAQHNDWMTDHQFELARKFQQSSVAQMYDLLPELRKDHEKIKAIPQKAVDAKIKELEKSNEALREAYEAHIAAQEKLLAIYRERYTPSVDGDDEKEEENEKETNSDDENEEGEAGDDSPSDLPNKGGPPVRPGMWAKNLQQSVRGLFGPKKDESEEDDKEDNKDDNESEGDKANDGFSISSPVSGGSLKDKFILSFGSPTSSAMASGILANFTAPILSTFGVDDKKENDDSEVTSNQESAQDSAAAVWKIPGGGSMDKSSLPETMAERRAKRAAARMASRPDASASSTRKREPSTNGTVTSRSELLERARKARMESSVALDNSRHKRTESPTPSNRTGRSSKRSSGAAAPYLSATGADKTSNTNSSASRSSVKDLLAKAGDSRRKLRENDSRMESLAHKKNQLQKASPLNSPSGASIYNTSSGHSTVSEERRLRIKNKLQGDDPLGLSSQHSLHERKPRTPRSSPEDKLDESVGNFNSESLMDVEDFGEQ